MREQMERKNRKEKKTKNSKVGRFVRRNFWTIFKLAFKVYHEEESIFSKITLEENNDAVKKMKLNAQENAIANGLLENARSNAETMLTGFFADEYDLDEYKIVFKDK